MAPCPPNGLRPVLSQGPRSCVGQPGFTLLDLADQLLAEIGAITLLADRAFPSAELLGWYTCKPRWQYVMRLRGVTEIHGTAAPLGCQVRRLRLPRGSCRGFRDVRPWGDGSQRANLLPRRPGH